MNKPRLILSLFPGADLFGRPFESLGYCVVRGPELMFDQDIRDFHPPAGVFWGVIGGPPCQLYSQASGGTSRAEDLIPEYVRVVREAAPAWSVMENVDGAKKSPGIPSDWIGVRLCDAELGGGTMRKRTFWCSDYRMAMLMQPPPPSGRRRNAAYSVCSFEGRGAGTRNMREKGIATRNLRQAAELQGFPELGARWIDDDYYRRVVQKAIGIFWLGNGVPRAMGQHVAETVKRWEADATD